MKRVVVLVVALAFLLTCSFAFAADKWVVTKDKNGVCRVIKAQEKTPTTIAGPFNSEKEAEAAKAKECGKVEPSKAAPKAEPKKK